MALPIGPVLYEFSKHVIRCSNCGQILRRGIPRFGPKEVGCSNCNTINRTGLKEWKDFSLISQIGIAITEIIAPSRFGKIFYSFLFYSLVIIVIGFFSSVAFIAKWPFCGIGILVFWVPVLVGGPILRLIRLIKESNKYSETKVPPLWKKSVILK